MTEPDKILNNIAETFKTLCGNKELFERIVEEFPYPIQVYDTEGTSVYINKALMKEYNLTDPSMVIGKYNIFKDPSIIAMDYIPEIRRVFRGETAYFYDIKVPLEDIIRRYGIKDLDTIAIYQDITIFPIKNNENRVVCIAALLINRRVYRGKEEIEKAKEYLETHWLEKFDLGETAKVACLSRAHFIKLFKRHTGMMPYDYYLNYKIDRLKEKLLDPNLSIIQAFAACNMNYNGHTAGLFKNKTGFRPSEYRKILKKSS